MATQTTLDREQVAPAPRPQSSAWFIAALVALPFLIFVFGRLIGGAVGDEMNSIAAASLQVLPFMVLAVLSYLGIHHLWAKIASFGWLAMLVGGGVFVAFLIGLVTLIENPGTVQQTFVAGAGPKILLLLIGSLVSILVAALGFIPGVRYWLSRFIPINPESFVHTMALVTVVGLTLNGFLQLAALGVPSLLTLIDTMVSQGGDLSSGRGDSGMLRDTLYGLVWLVPATIIAVGYGIERGQGQALQRLGLVRPTLAQVFGGIGMAILLVGAVTLLSVGIDWLWTTMGWPRTEGEAVNELFSFAISPVGAVVIGITAGLGEELAVRGVLQPRLGILLSNLFFTSLHAYQYNWDSLLVVFAIGMVLGVIRQRTNTTTSAIVHGVYDFLLIMAAALQIPWLSGE